MRKHRKYGGETHTVKGHGKESATEGDDDAEKDLKDDPKDRLKASKVSEMSEEDSDEGEEHSKGGRAKRKAGGAVPGAAARKHGGRAARASGGSCEDNPFTAANHGTPAKGRKTAPETQGKDK